jgi:hypothetical protein
MSTRTTAQLQSELEAMLAASRCRAAHRARIYPGACAMRSAAGFPLASLLDSPVVSPGPSLPVPLAAGESNSFPSMEQAA